MDSFGMAVSVAPLMIPPSIKIMPAVPRASTTRSPELVRVFMCFCARFSISSVVIARSMIGQNSG